MKKILPVAVAMAGLLMAGSTTAWAQAVLPRAGWVATGSSSASGNPATNALDGSANTRWSTGADQTAGQWFSLDMIQNQIFSEVTIDPAGSSSDFTTAYQVFVSNDAVAWSPVASGTGSTGILTITFPTQVARFIGIVQTGTGSHWWSIAEINVYGPGALPTVALSPTGWSASASDTGGSDVANHAIDSLTSTRWTTGKPQASGESFQVDMLSARVVKELTMDSGGSTSDYPRAFQVFATNSIGNWGPAIASGTGTSSVTHLAFPAVSARYLKIVLTGSASSWWSIAELAVFAVGTFDPVATVLPRTGWTAAASASCSSDIAPKALDDDPSTRFSTCQSQAAGQSFQVDMQAPTSFSSVTLDAGASSGDYPRALSLYVSNDATNWGSAIVTTTGTAQLVTLSFPFQTARYIKVVLNGSASNWWSIYEFNVYGIRPVLSIRDGWVASASLNSSVASSALDGKLSTRWSTGTPQLNQQMFQVDMLAPQTFNKVVLDSDGASDDFPRGYQVFTTNDPTAWGSPVASGTASATPVSIALPTQTKRYLRIVQTGAASNWWSISELNVWRTAVSNCVTAANCDDGDRCTADSCDAVLGCVHALVACTRQGRIEAESFDSASGMSNNGTSMSPTLAGASLQFNHVDFGAPGSFGRLQIGLLGSPGNRHIQFHLDSQGGPLLADIFTLPSDPQLPAPQSSLFLTPTSGVHAVFVIFVTADTGSLDWFSLQPGAGDQFSAFPSSFHHPSSGAQVVYTNLPNITSGGDDDVPPVAWMQLPAPQDLAPSDELTYTFQTTSEPLSIIAQARWTVALGALSLVVTDSHGTVVGTGGATSMPAGGSATVQTSPLPPQVFSVKVKNNGTAHVPVNLLAGAVRE
jgi:hypothetical protein